MKENVILAGVIPGPKEPELHLNSFLQPLVSDLMQLWDGICMKSSNNVSIMVRAALLCVGCEMPAARKVCCFLGHRATMGCSKCLHAFPTERFVEKADYSNFKRTEWRKRTNDHHRSEAMKCRSCVTKSEQTEIERSGVRYIYTDIAVDSNNGTLLLPSVPIPSEKQPFSYVASVISNIEQQSFTGSQR